MPGLKLNDVSNWWEWFLIIFFYVFALGKYFFGKYLFRFLLLTQIPPTQNTMFRDKSRISAKKTDQGGNMVPKIRIKKFQFSCKRLSWTQMSPWPWLRNQGRADCYLHDKNIFRVTEKYAICHISATERIRTSIKWQRFCKRCFQMQSPEAIFAFCFKILGS